MTRRAFRSRVIPLRVVFASAETEPFGGDAPLHQRFSHNPLIRLEPDYFYHGWLGIGKVCSERRCLAMTWDRGRAPYTNARFHRLMVSCMVGALYAAYYCFRVIRYEFPFNDPHR